MTRSLALIPALAAAFSHRSRRRLHADETPPPKPPEPTPIVVELTLKGTIDEAPGTGRDRAARPSATT